MSLDHRLQVHTLEQFHYKVECTVFRDPEVEQLDGVWRTQVRGGFRLAVKTLDSNLRIGVVVAAEHLGPDELYRCRPREHRVSRPVDLTHTPALEKLAELVAAHLSSL